MSADLYEHVPFEQGCTELRHILVPVSMRWMPYKPSSEQYRKGLRGRWQRATEYGWENCDPPKTYLKPVGDGQR